MKIVNENGKLVTVEADEGKFLDIGGAIGKSAITPKDAVHLIQEISAKEAKRREAIYSGIPADVFDSSGGK